MKNIKIIVLPIFIVLICLIFIITSCSQEKRYTAEEWQKLQLVENTTTLKKVEFVENTTTSKGEEQIVENAISWDEAKYHIGERVTVYGPVITAYYYKEGKNDPTFLNIGNAHPNPDRFAVVIWGNNRSNFSQAPEVYYNGRAIYVYGLIVDYEGVPEIEVSNPSQITE